MKDDAISRRAALKGLEDLNIASFYEDNEHSKGAYMEVKAMLKALPSAQPEQTDCEYCHEDSDGYVRSIEKNSHAWLVRRGRTMKLRVGFKGEYRECDILFCPMCGRRLMMEMGRGVEA